MRVAVVHRLRPHPHGENPVSYCVHPHVVAGHIGLELGRTVSQELETGEAIRLEAADDRADAASRLVDHRTVRRVEGARGFGIVCHEGWRWA